MAPVLRWSRVFGFFMEVEKWTSGYGVIDGTVEVEVTGGGIIRQIDEKGEGKEDKEQKKYLVVDKGILI